MKTIGYNGVCNDEIDLDEEMAENYYRMKTLISGILEQRNEVRKGVLIP